MNWDNLNRNIKEGETPLAEIHEAGIPKIENLRKERKLTEIIINDLLDRYPRIFAHQDLHLKNIIYNECKDSVTFVDWEMAGYGVLPLELAKITDDYGGLHVDEGYRRQWIKLYLELEQVKEKMTPNLDGNIEKMIPNSEIDQLYRDVIRGHAAIKFTFVSYGMSMMSTKQAKDEKGKMLDTLKEWYLSYLNDKNEIMTFNDGFSQLI